MRLEPQRLGDYWLTISKASAFAAPTATIPREKTVPGLWQKRIRIMPSPSLTIDTPGAVGRYVRVQLARETADSQNILSLAEIEVYAPAGESADSIAKKPADPLVVHSFACNNANALQFDVESSEPVTMKYLLWDNPRLRYTLNGKPIKPAKNEGLIAIDLPTGRNVICIAYYNWMFGLFWVVYAIYAAIAAWAGLTMIVAAARAQMNNPLIRAPRP
jgi:hypothetical protein